MPPAARLTDMHVCPMQTPAVVPIPHVGGPIVAPGAPTVLIGGLPAARITDMCVCVGPPDVIVKGSMGVMIMGLNAARIGDMTAHGGVIVAGFPTVIIGEIGVVAPTPPKAPAMPALPGLPAVPAVAAPPAAPDVSALENDLLADMAQTTLDIAGIVDPTPISDALSGIMSAARGDALGVAISIASMIPYAGDLSKLGKLPKLAKSVEKAVELIKAAPNSAFAKRAMPALQALGDALEKLPLDMLPKSARDAVQAIVKTIDDSEPSLAAIEKNVARKLFEFADVLKGKSFQEAEAILDKELLGAGYTKKALKNGDGLRYIDGKGNSVSINKGYPKGLKGGGGDAVHKGPYVKIQPGDIRFPLGGK